MWLRKFKNSDGFSIMELIIVLAVSGLIMTVVFVAVPSLRKSARDHYRKQYAGDTLSASLDFYRNNKKIPVDASSASRFITDYMPKGTDPSLGNDYTSSSTHPANKTVNGACDGEASANDATTYCWDTTAGNIDHNFVPAKGRIIITAGLVCDNSGVGTVTDPPGAGSGAVVLSVVIGIERGNFYCVSNDLSN
jgi:prepilin-type N-terminal cleavage/methylation domain-containing protein